MIPSQALDDVLAQIDADLDASLDRLFDFLRIQSISTDPAYKDHAAPPPHYVAADLDRHRLRCQRAADRRDIRSWSEKLPADDNGGNGSRACCSTATTTCSRSIRSTCGSRRRSRRARDPARRPQNHRCARRLRRQRPGHDLRRGLPRLQGGHRHSCRCRSP